MEGWNVLRKWAKIRAAAWCVIAAASPLTTAAQAAIGGDNDGQAASSSTGGNAADSAAVATRLSKRGFFHNLAQAYLDDWKGTASNAEEPKFRGYPAPASNPPFPFAGSAIRT
jgi:hypothetical protein